MSSRIFLEDSYFTFYQTGLRGLRTATFRDLTKIIKFVILKKCCFKTSK